MVLSFAFAIHHIVMYIYIYLNSSNTYYLYMNGRACDFVCGSNVFFFLQLAPCGQSIYMGPISNLLYCIYSKLLKHKLIVPPSIMAHIHLEHMEQTDIYYFGNGHIHTHIYSI